MKKTLYNRTEYYKKIGIICRSDVSNTLPSIKKIKDILHREDGPAVEYFSGDKEWWINGERLNCTSQEEFEKLMKLRVFW
jgi:hypothetical protein